MNSQDGFPGSVSQVSNFLGIRGEVKSMASRCEPSAAQLIILYGLGTLVPDKLINSGILDDKNRIEIVDALLVYQIRLNDRIDFANTQNDIRSEVAESEMEALVQLRESLAKLQSPELNRIVESSIKEVEIAESYIASRRSMGSLSFDEIEMYRNVVNAISICTVTVAILGQHWLADRLYTLPLNETNWEGVCKKYQWIVNFEYKKSVERAILIMHSLGMAAQIDDDWHGKHIDRAMGISSFASMALLEKGQNHRLASEFLNDIKGAYLAKARKLGLNPVAVQVIDKAQKVAQRVMRWATCKARYSCSPLLKDVLNNRAISKMGVREQAFVRGYI